MLKIKKLCEKILGLKIILRLKNFGLEKTCVSKKKFCWNFFLVVSDIADFGGVLFVLLVTWVLRTPNPLN